MADTVRVKKSRGSLFTRIFLWIFGYRWVERKIQLTEEYFGFYEHYITEGAVVTCKNNKESKIKTADREIRPIRQYTDDNGYRVEVQGLVVSATWESGYHADMNTESEFVVLKEGYIHKAMLKALNNHKYNKIESLYD